jgi:hypothetical protein
MTGVISIATSMASKTFFQTELSPRDLLGFFAAETDDGRNRHAFYGRDEPALHALEIQ